MKKTIIFQGENPVRIDIFLSSHINRSRSFIGNLIKSGKVTVNEDKVKSSRILNRGEKIIFELIEDNEVESVPNETKIPIIYEDENLLVVDKPAGIVTYDEVSRGWSVYSGIRDQLNIKEERGGVIHRLDKDTSGIIIFAKNKETEAKMKDLFKNRKVTKRYLALVEGQLEADEAYIDIPIMRKPSDTRMSTSLSGKVAKSHYRVINKANNLSLLEVEISTGRTHQIRVHLKAIGHPVVGDKIYGNEKTNLSRQFLHASFVQFESDGKVYKFQSDLPVELRDYLTSFGFSF